MQPFPTIPGYELLACLGGGAMTAVYSARESSTDLACAIKMPRPDGEDRPMAIKLLQREARAGLATRHRHLVPMIDVHVWQEPYYLVMELLDGESLRDRLRRHYHLAPSEALRIIRQVAEALAALHRVGYLHGDIKPENVRLKEDGAAVLLDLGFAHRPGENAALFRDGYLLGSPNYLAPELCDAEPIDSLANDLFGLGVTLFEMLTGRLPYPAGSLRQTFRRHRCDPPADIRRLIGTVPAPLVTLIEDLLTHRPEDRPRIGEVVRILVNLEIETMGRRRSA